MSRGNRDREIQAILICKACREELSLKKNIIVSDVSSAKHKTGKDKLAWKETEERDIARLLRDKTILKHLL